MSNTIIKVVGVLCVLLSGLYLFVVPMVRVSHYPMERLYVSHFLILGMFGLVLLVVIPLTKIQMEDKAP